MRLKDTVTNKQLRELEWITSGTYAYFEINDATDLEIDYTSRELIITGLEDSYKLPDILLKMFQLGYIEESEEA